MVFSWRQLEVALATPLRSVLFRIGGSSLPH